MRLRQRSQNNWNLQSFMLYVIIQTKSMIITNSYDIIRKTVKRKRQLK